MKASASPLPPSLPIPFSPRPRPARRLRPPGNFPARRLGALGRAAALLLTVAWALPAPAQTPGVFRPPAVPLIAHDPMLSIWSEADHLTDDTTRHWTHREQSLVSLIRVDGQTYRLMGKTPASVPALPQTNLTVTPTHSVYEFEGANVHVTLTFLSPLLPDDLDVFARPVTYLTWTVRALDVMDHSVSIYDGTSSQICVNEPNEKVEWGRQTMGPLTALHVGTESQNLVGTTGDDTRINWGYAYVAAPAAEASAVIGPDDDLTARFITTGTLPDKDDSRMPRAVEDAEPVLAFAFDLGKVRQTPVSRHLLIGYDQVYIVRFFYHNLRPYWRRNGAQPADLFLAAERDYAALTARCEQFDKALIGDAEKAGGSDYGKICALAYRQCFAGHGLAADANGQPLMFTKENSSNGDISTADIMFPAAPLPLLVSPTLAKATLVPLLAYAASDHWKFPNAPHDLGTYPVARGTDDGGEQMPVEESGNLLLLCDAICQLDGNTKFVDPWWPELTQWTKYLEQFGLDPGEQLCTDDFMGHLAHNSNLSVKAILAFAAYADMCRLRGDREGADRFARLAKDDAAHWIKVNGTGSHSLLAFDRPDTWSQKYNLVWDKILRLNVFPPEVARKEVAFYKTVLQPYGLPLDSRTKLTKTDWTVWSATLASSQADFETLIAPIVKYLNVTTARLPFVDSYETNNPGKTDLLFRARPVIGGVFMRLLADRPTWLKWASADHTKLSNWALLPLQPSIVEVIPTSQQVPQLWRNTTQRPPDRWTASDFDDRQWQLGPAGFGNQGFHRTDWTTEDIWIRRTFTMPAGNYRNLEFNVFHDEDVEIYVNGVLAASANGFVTSYDVLPIKSVALDLLKPGATITLAVHCHQTTGGQGIDVGIADVTE